MTRSSRTLSTVTNNLKNHFKVAVVGAGPGGLSVASQLKNSLLPAKDIAIIDPAEYHFYQPMWTLVGGGLKTIEESRRPMSDVIQTCLSQDARHIAHRVERIEPQENRIQLSDGSQINYDYLVLSPGIQCKWDAIHGLREALEDEDSPVCSIYHPRYARKTWRLIQSVGSKADLKAIFTQPSTPIKCAGAPQKIMYLAEELWRLSAPSLQISFCSGMGKIFSAEKYAKRLEKICENRGIAVRLFHELVKLDSGSRKALFKHLPTGNVEGFDYDFIHVTPPMAPRPFVSQSGLGNDAGYVDVDKYSLQHLKYKNVFSLGDASSLPTSKTAAAIASQTSVLASNLLSQMESDTRNKAAPGSSTVPAESMKQYDGYTSCPLITGRGKLMLAEFSGYDLQPRETFWFDQGEERESMYDLTLKVLPFLYWEGMLKGLWNGPAKLKPILNPLNRN